jgi:hypothetical protein
MHSVPAAGGGQTAHKNDAARIAQPAHRHEVHEVTSICWIRDDRGLFLAGASRCAWCGAAQSPAMKKRQVPSGSMPARQPR